MRKLFFCISLLALLGIATAQTARPMKLMSPDKTTMLEMSINNKQLQYRVSFRNSIVLNWSNLELEFGDRSSNDSLLLVATSSASSYEKIPWRLGESDTITNHYNQLISSFVNSMKRFEIIARVYDGSIAFRYKLYTDEKLLITKEGTTFNLSQPLTIYQYNEESVFTPKLIDTFTNSCDFPATLAAKNFYVSIGEADNTGYTKAELVKGAAANSLAIKFPRDKAVEVSGSYLTPWRTISIARSAIGLHRFSDLNLRLASNPVDKIPGWIKPGKLIRAQLTTQHGLDCIDFASTHQFQYIMFDAGWYGAEFRGSSDPTQSIPEIEMQKVIDYGKEKGIGVILYVNYVGLKQKLDTILPLYRKWGVAGLKFGFVDGLTQQGIQWLNAAIKKVYDHGFVLNIHDNYKPTGLSRAYPQLLTQEGIRGDENSPDAFHNTTLPFTRFLAGPADFTFCYPNTSNSYSKNIKVSMAQQLALPVIYFSPLQSVFWYGLPKQYTNEEEIEFFKFVPTVWNESHYLAGEIGKNISVARRHGKEWFIGSIAGLEDWNSSIRLDFLAAGKKYTATIYEDADGTISKKQAIVKKGDVLNFEIKARGGRAIILR